MEEKIYEETREFIDILKTRCSQPLFMHNIFDVSVINGLWAMMAGQRFEIDDERLVKLLKIIHDAFRVVDMSGGLLNQMPFLRFISPRASGYNKLREVLTRMWEFLGVSLRFINRYSSPKSASITKYVMHNKIVTISNNFCHARNYHKANLSIICKLHFDYTCPNWFATTASAPN